MDVFARALAGMRMALAAGKVLKTQKGQLRSYMVDLRRKMQLQSRLTCNWDFLQ